MTATTPRKGRPTPTAPQNRRDGIAPTTYLVSDEVHHHEMSPAEIMRRAYEAYRRRTRPFRSAFRGIVPFRDAQRHGQAARSALVRDCYRVRDYRDASGVGDVPTLAQRLGLPQGRVRQVLKALSALETTEPTVTA